MKNKLVKILIAAMTTIALINTNTLEVNNKDTSDILLNDRINMSSIDKIQFKNIEIYNIDSRKAFDSLTPILQHRNGKIIIEIINGIMLDDNGNGKDTAGKYIKYDNQEFSKGDKIQSIFIYNPETNANDDILYRIDTLIW